MTANVGSLDRIIRTIIGLACIALVFIGPFAGTGWERIAFAIVGIVLILTSAIQFCPLYRMMGIQTCPPNKLD
jgi:membrane-bound ClpP family serine protease